MLCVYSKQWIYFPSFIVMVQTAERKSINVMLFDTWRDYKEPEQQVHEEDVVMVWSDSYKAEEFYSNLCEHVCVCVMIKKKTTRASSPASVFLPTRLTKKSAVWGRLRWTDTNQLPRRESERQIYSMFRIRPGEGVTPGQRRGTRKTERLSCVQGINSTRCSGFQWGVQLSDSKVLRLQRRCSQGPDVN